MYFLYRDVRVAGLKLAGTPMQARQRPFCPNSSPDLSQLAVQAVRKSAGLVPEAAGARSQGVAAGRAAGRGGCGEADAVSGGIMVMQYGGV